MFHDPGRFAFVPEFERSWRAISEEFSGIREGLIPWPERELHGTGWDVFGLFDFPQGHRIAANAERCPITASLVERLFSAHGAAGFSVLRPGTRIRPHRGYAGAFLRVHLGLSVPEGDCALRVGEETRKWAEGRVLIFDDRVEHEAWNLTDAERVVLLVDFVPPA
jgi:beta-hydroxylase